MSRLLMRWLLVLTLPLMLTACDLSELLGSDGDAPAALVDDGGDDDDDNGGGDPSRVSGSVVKGIAAGAVISAYAQGADGDELLASTVSGADGSFALDLPADFRGAVTIVATAAGDGSTRLACDAARGCGLARGDDGDTDDSGSIDFGERYAAPEDFELRAVAVVGDDGLPPVNLSPLSTLVAAWAKQFPQGLDARSVRAAQEQVAAAFGLERADLSLPLGDLTDPLWVNLASDEQLRVALLAAAFAELAAAQDRAVQDLVDEAARAFAGRQGRLLQLSHDGGPHVAGFLSAAGDIAATELPAARADALRLAWQTQLDGLVAGELTAAPDLSLMALLNPLGELGRQLLEVRDIAGLDDLDGFLAAQGPKFEWLLTEETFNIFPLALDVVYYSVMGSMILDRLGPGDSDPYEVVNDGSLVVSLDRANRILNFSGERYGQSVSINVGLTALQGGAAAGEYHFDLDGAASNAVSSGEIQGTLHIDMKGTDLQPVITALYAIMDGDEDTGPLLLALYDLAYNLRARVDLEGSAALTRNDDPTQLLGGNLVLAGAVNFGAAPDEVLGWLDVSEGELFLPNGDHFYSLPGKSLLKAKVIDSLTFTLDAGADTLGIPTAYAHASGELTNTRDLFNHVRESIVEGVAGGDDIFTILFAALDFNFATMVPRGEGSIVIPELDHEYRATLEGNLVTVYQPHSDEVAATAELDLRRMAVHMKLGDEPWDLRLSTYEGMSLVLVGPDGLAGELTEDDIMAMLSLLPLDSLLGSLAGSDAGDLVL